MQDVPIYEYTYKARIYYELLYHNPEDILVSWGAESAWFKVLKLSKRPNVVVQKRFKDIESSIKKREGHVMRLEDLVKEVPDDA